MKVSGGLDSLAALAHVVRAASGRRVIAFTTDLTCDAGISTAAVVRRLLIDLDLNAELVVIDLHRERTEPIWSSVGPRLDALPEVNAATAEIAARLGVGLLLSGDGADELLGVPRFATAHIAARRGPWAAVRYDPVDRLADDRLPQRCPVILAQGQPPPGRVHAGKDFRQWRHRAWHGSSQPLVDVAPQIPTREPGGLQIPCGSPGSAVPAVPPAQE